MSQGTGDPTTVEFRATGLNVDGAISAAVSIAVIYVVTWFLVLGYFNDFWYSFIFATKVNSATIKEKKERSEKDLNLNKLVKLGTAPTNSVEIEKAPETRASIRKTEKIWAFMVSDLSLGANLGNRLLPPRNASSRVALR